MDIIKDKKYCCSFLLILKLLLLKRRGHTDSVSRIPPDCICDGLDAAVINLFFHEASSNYHYNCKTFYECK